MNIARQTNAPSKLAPPPLPKRRGLAVVPPLPKLTSLDDGAETTKVDAAPAEAFSRRPTPPRPRAASDEAPTKSSAPPPLPEPVPPPAIVNAAPASVAPASVAPVEPAPAPAATPVGLILPAPGSDHELAASMRPRGVLLVRTAWFFVALVAIESGRSLADALRLARA